MTVKKKEPKFEEAIARLEQIVGKLENGEVSLDESIKLFQEGRELGRKCAAQLADVEKKARLLLEDEDGAVRAEPFEPEKDGSEDENEDEDPSTGSTGSLQASLRAGEDEDEPEKGDE